MEQGTVTFTDVVALAKFIATLIESTSALFEVKEREDLRGKYYEVTFSGSY